jgi:hypothetical protein
MTFISILLAILFFASLWMVFVKAGQPGWAAIIPIYNVFVMLQVAKRPLWWFLLLLVPLVNIVISFIVMIDIAKAFGKSVLFGIGLTLLGFIFLPILAFGDAEYE